MALLKKLTYGLSTRGDFKTQRAADIIASVSRQGKVDTENSAVGI